MIIRLRIGIWKLTFLHLISHALFKSLLFLCAGLIIHSINNFQDIRFYGGLLYIYPITIFIFITSSLRLGGFPFLAGFYSKDLILENIFFIRNNLIWIIFLFRCILTLSYRLRLFYHLFIGNINLLNLNYNNENKIIFYSINFLLSIRIIGGSLLYWIYFLNTKLSFPRNLIKNLIISILIIRIIIYLIYHTFNFLKQFKYFYLLKFIFNIINLRNFFNIIYLPYLNHALIYNKLLEKGWLDITINKITFNLILSTIFNIKFSFRRFILFLLIIITVSIIASFL